MQNMTVTDTQHDPYHHGDLPNALLAAVGDIVEEKGAANVSLREAARRAGVSHSAPAHHFGDKEGMLAAFCHQGHQILAAEMQAAFTDAGDAPPDRRISVAGEAYVRFADAHRAHFDVMFRTGLAEVTMASHHEFQEQGAMALLRGLVDELVVMGVAEPEEAEAVAVCLWSSAHGLASLWVDGAIADAFPGLTLDELLEQAFGPSQIALRTVVGP